MEKILSSAWIFLMLSTMLSVDASASEWMAFSCIKPFGRDKQMRNTLIPILVAICLFITGVAILNIQLWYSAKQSTAGARYAANNINHILEEASQATQTAVNIAGKECNLEEQYQLGTEAALKPHLRTIIILKQGIVWCTSCTGIGSCCLVFLFSRTVIYCWLQQSTPLIDYLSCSIRTNLQIRAFWLR